MLYMPPERRTVFGVLPNTVRLSAGIEKTEILLQDLEQALEKIDIYPQDKISFINASKRNDTQILGKVK